MPPMIHIRMGLDMLYSPKKTNLMCLQSYLCHMWCGCKLVSACRIIFALVLQWRDVPLYVWSPALVHISQGWSGEKWWFQVNLTDANSLWMIWNILTIPIFPGFLQWNKRCHNLFLPLVATSSIAAVFINLWLQPHISQPISVHFGPLLPKVEVLFFWSFTFSWSDVQLELLAMVKRLEVGWQVFR